MHTVNHILSALAMATCSGCVRSIELTLHADVLDGSTAVSKVEFETHTVAESSDDCFDGGTCEMTVGPGDLDHEDGVRLTAWADPEGDDLDAMGDVDDLGPEPGEPEASKVVDIPATGVLEVELDLE